MRRRCFHRSAGFGCGSMLMSVDMPCLATAPPSVYVEVRARLAPVIEIPVSDNQRIGVNRLPCQQQGLERSELLGGELVGADQAHAKRVMVMLANVSAMPIRRAAQLDGAVQSYDSVVADAGPATLQVPAVNVLGESWRPLGLSLQCTTRYLMSMACPCGVRCPQKSPPLWAGQRRA